MYQLCQSVPGLGPKGPAPRPGGNWLLASWKLCMARPSCLRLFWHLARAAASRTFWTAGMRSPIRIAMMAITTSSSISVNPRRTGVSMVLSFRGRTGRTTTNPGRGRELGPLGDVEIDRVRVWLGHRLVLFGVHVPVLGDELLGDDVGPAAGAGRFVRVHGVDRRDAVARGDADEVLALLQPGLSRDVVGPVGDDRGGPGVLPLGRFE